MLPTGSPAPWFHAAALDGNPRYAFNSVAGRWVVMLFMGSAKHVQSQSALRLLQRHRAIFDDDRACFFGVTIDSEDAGKKRIASSLPGVRWFIDDDGMISKLYGALESKGQENWYKPHWLLLDPMLRVHSFASIRGGQDIFDELLRLLAQEPLNVNAPVLVVPRVLSSEDCQKLIRFYQTRGGKPSGFMRERNGTTTAMSDASFKRRSDVTIDDEDLLARLKARMAITLRPMIHHAFQFDATRVERFIVACYDAKTRGHFRAHRDNTTKGTAHRRFACTINLNADSYEGGDLRFPEFGRRTYRAPTGGAIIFSCSLLHEVEPITNGQRFAFLPFLYDESAALLRERNLQYVTDDLKDYRSGLKGNEDGPALTHTSDASAAD